MSCRGLRPEYREAGGVADGDGSGIVWSWNDSWADQNESCAGILEPSNMPPEGEPQQGLTALRLLE